MIQSKLNFDYMSYNKQTFVMPGNISSEFEMFKLQKKPSEYITTMKSEFFSLKREIFYSRKVEYPVSSIKCYV